MDAVDPADTDGERGMAVVQLSDPTRPCSSSDWPQEYFTEVVGGEWLLDHSEITAEHRDTISEGMRGGQSDGVDQNVTPPVPTCSESKCPTEPCLMKRRTPDFSDREVFFDLVWEVQSRRFNDQRCSFRRVRDRRLYRSMPSSPLDRENSIFASMSSLQTEEFFDLIACSQSRRLNDQRADFEDCPTAALCTPFPVEYLAPLGSMAYQTPSGESPAATVCPRSEQAPADEGHPVAGAGEQPAGSEQGPADGGKAPAEREELPAESGGDPAEVEEAPAERGKTPAESGKIPAEGEAVPAEDEVIPTGSEDRAAAARAEIPAERQDIAAEEEEAPLHQTKYLVHMSTGKTEPDDELYNTILTHQSASARIEDQRCDPPAYSTQALFDLLQRMQEQRMDEQRAHLPPGLAPRRAAARVQEERRPSIFSPLLKGMSQRRANSN
ncbi:fibrous sheath CABYR-binding protein-like isoform X2 [Stegostoma tigrinum]|uniref:fibrous sheath CABYR-binding protein-like isoform X2 n=1 Tax=Stegostoma tigrinum TaxID=3053191 RepID=UPI00202B1D90|nr:fibrous sheath CABYR-binding protein-like isoform X2 [Stegostoma tigrinum]